MPSALVLERRRRNDSDSTAAAVQRKMESTHTDSYAPSVYLILRSHLAMYYDYYKHKSVVNNDRGRLIMQEPK